MIFAATSVAAVEQLDVGAVIYLCIVCLLIIGLFLFIRGLSHLGSARELCEPSVDLHEITDPLLPTAPVPRTVGIMDVSLAELTLDMCSLLLPLFHRSPGLYRELCQS